MKSIIFHLRKVPKLSTNLLFTSLDFNSSPMFGYEYGVPRYSSLSYKGIVLALVNYLYKYKSARVQGYFQAFQPSFRKLEWRSHPIHVNISYKH